MHILIIGGSGRTGSLAISEALTRKHTVTALVRDPSKLQPRQGVTLLGGSPLNPTDISTAFSQTPIDAVIITLNARRASEIPFAKPISPPRMMADSMANISKAMAAHGVRKIAFMSAFGVGSSFPNLPWIMQWMVRKSNMAAQFEDHDAVDSELRAETELEWVLVRPARLTEGAKMAVKDLGDTGEKAGFFASVSRASVASFLVDVVESNEWNRRSPVIGN